MFYYLYLFLLGPIYSLVSSLRWRDQDRDILLLRQQLLIIQRHLGWKPAYGRLEKLALLLAALRLSKQRLAAALLIVQPGSFANITSA
jgi:hypothetical protein